MDDLEDGGFNLDLQSPAAYFYMHSLISSQNPSEEVPGEETNAHENPGTSSREGWR